MVWDGLKRPLLGISSSLVVVLLASFSCAKALYRFLHGPLRALMVSFFRLHWSGFVKLFLPKSETIFVIQVFS